MRSFTTDTQKGHRPNAFIPHSAMSSSAALSREATLPTVHLLHGLPGSGKTTFARQLEASTGAILLNHDELTATVLGSTPTTPDFQRWSQPLHELIWSLTAKLVGRKFDVILDHGFWTRADRDAARARVHALGALPKLYALTCDAATADARVIARNRQALPGALMLDQATLDFFRAKFEPLAADEPHIEIDNNLPPLPSS